VRTIYRGQASSRHATTFGAIGAVSRGQGLTFSSLQALSVGPCLTVRQHECFKKEHVSEDPQQDIIDPSHYLLESFSACSISLEITRIESAIVQAIVTDPSATSHEDQSLRFFMSQLGEAWSISVSELQ